MESSRVDILLKRALSSAETPAPELIQKTKYNIDKETTVLRKTTVRHSFRVAAIAVLVIAVLSTTAFAAWHFLKPAEVAEQIGNHALSAAFESDTAININVTKTSGDYSFTLLAVVSGSDVTDMPYYSDEILNDKTYAVLAIQKADGSAMPSAGDGDYNPFRFFASPLVKGLEPWRVNAFFLNGASSATVVDGIEYRIVECDNMTMFADRGLYFAVADVMTFSNSTFLFNETSGEITINPDLEGVSAVFDLPLDKSLADPAKAALLLSDLYPPADAESPPITENGDYVFQDEAVTLK